MRSRTVVAIAAAALLASTVASSCSTPPPVASNAVPPPAVAEEKPIVWVALGGDETLVGDLHATPNAWTQRVLSRLPPSAQLLDLATDDASIRTGLDNQLRALETSQIKPTVATVWFGTADANTPRQQFTADLTALIDRLKGDGVQRVILVSRPNAASDRGYRFAGEIEAVANATGATYVPVVALTGSPNEPTAQNAIADQLAPLVAGK